MESTTARRWLLAALGMIAVAVCSIAAWRPMTVRAESSVEQAAATTAQSVTSAAAPTGRYVAGDFHTHTWLSDGKARESAVVAQAFKKYGLDWIANSDHGGASVHDPYGHKLAHPMWRSRALDAFSFPIVRRLRSSYPSRRIVQSVEWYVPGHDHANVGIVADEPTAVGDFDYRFDRRNNDRSKPSLSKHNTAPSDAITAARWLQTHYPDDAYLIVNHPSRKRQFSAACLRDLNDAAPTVAFGFEGIPGRQKLSTRSGYSYLRGGPGKRARTYGGADYFLAKVGGVWDSLLAEGRRFWVFGNSDFHKAGTDFWPGQYTRSYTFVSGDGYRDLLAGMRSGNSFTVTGGLLNALEFSAASEGATATMGQTLSVPKGSNVRVTVRFRVPARRPGPGKPSVDHIDLISGRVHAKAPRGTPGYSAGTAPSAKVIKRFRRSAPWRGYRTHGNWHQVTYQLTDVQADTYLRLRGTNLKPHVRGQTDAGGDPLIDPKHHNNSTVAWADSWFYSNPVFVKVTP